MTVPGTDILADIAAKDPWGNRCLVRLGQCAMELNGHVRNAAGTVHHLRRHYGPGGTGVQTAGARATVVRDGGIWGKIVVDDEFREEEKAAFMFAQQ